VFPTKPGWYLRYRVFGRTLHETFSESLKATTEKEAAEEATLLWEQKEKRSMGGYNLRGEWAEEVFPNTPQLIYFSATKIDCEVPDEAH
jgi:hypothetical protein